MIVALFAAPMLSSAGALLLLTMPGGALGGPSLALLSLFGGAA